MLLPILSLLFTINLVILSIAFRIAAKLRLTLPFLYFLLISTVLNPWAAAHERAALAILLALSLPTVISWLHTFKKYLEERRYEKDREDLMAWQLSWAHDQGIPANDFYIDYMGTLRYPDSDRPVIRPEILDI